MPWAPFSEPSLGLAILKAQLTREGIAARVFHEGPSLLRHLTAGAYQQIAECWGLDEFAFTGVLDGAFTDDQIQCVMERALSHTEMGSTRAFRNATELAEAVIELRHRIVPAYLAECAERILAYQPTMVGFTCMFDQTLAATALASLLRHSRPDLLIVLGGYALEGPPGIEILKAFPHIDAIALGDGEPAIGALARASVREGALHTIPGVVVQGDRQAPGRSLANLAESPAPDYDDWFADLKRLREEERVTIRTTVLPVESSRGCWWGQKHHCVFCGIDEETLKYRNKDADSVLAMLSHMRERYGDGMPFRFADYIFPARFHTELLPRLAAIDPPYELTCEIKANQTAEKIKAFADAGFAELQPGIESFDTHVLRLMDKGVSGMQNVFLLREGFRYGIQINYNFLYGLPGDRAEWYARMAKLLPRLFHLTPPFSRTETIVTRFAPLQTDPHRFGVATKPRHHRCYDCLFSEEFLSRTQFELDNYAYYFGRNFKYDADVVPHYWTLTALIDLWKRQHLNRLVELTWADDSERVTVVDSRRREAPVIREIWGVARDVFLGCLDKPIARRELADEVGASESDAEAAIEVLDRDELIWTEDELVFGLAIPETIASDYRARGWQRQWTSLSC
jgi:ribosomal peptide maturation radical SAM protein 1